MKRAMGVVNLINEVDYLEVLHRDRCVAAIPFGARYRLIDFILSSMVNSGMSNVAVLAHEKYRALMDHLGSGKEWDLDRKRSGLFILPPNLNTRREVARGDLYQFFCQRDYFHRSREDIVVMTRSHMVCNVDLSAVVEEHLASDSDITLVYKQTQEESAAQCRRIRIDESGRVVEMQDHNGRLDSDLISMEIFVMHKSFLMELVETSLAQGYDHFVRDAVMKNLSRIRMRGYEYSGYLGVINTVQSYYHNSMKLLDPAVWQSLFYNPGLIYTKIKDEPPARYASGSVVKNSLIANGCVIEGTVENSILFRGVHVAKDAVVRNSIILQNGVIENGASVIGSIMDKDVKVTRGKLLQGDPNSPYLAAKRSVI
jgi:glucose-1-phosphate adenylyltransferase